MPDTLGTAVLELDVDGSKLDNEMDSARKKVVKGAEDMEDAFDKKATKGANTFGKAMGDVGKIAGGFVLGAAITQGPALLLDMAKAAAEDEAATMRLNQAIRNLGGDFDEISGKVNDAIASGQELAFTDDEVRDSFQFLAAATGDADEALRRQKSAMDLARGANIPLATATKMLGKLNEENVEVFKKLGITLGDNASEADALAAVQAKFGGQSKEYARSTAGQFAVAQIQMAELKESIGMALIPVMLLLGKILVVTLIPAMQILANTIIPALTSGIEKVGAIIQSALGNEVIVAALIGLGAAMAVVAGVTIATLIPSIIAWIAAEAAKTVALIASAAAFIAANAPLILIAAGIALLVMGIILLVKHWDEIVEKVPALGVAFEAVKTGLMAFASWITGSFVPAVAEIYNAVAEPIGDAIAFVKDHWDEIRAVIEPALKILVTVIETELKLIKVYIETTLKIIKGIIDVFIGVLTGDWEQAWRGIQEIFGAVWDGIKAALKVVLDGITSLPGWKAVENVAKDVADFISARVEDIKGSFNSALSFISGLPGQFRSAARSLGEAIADGIVDGIMSITNAFGDIAGAIRRTIRNAMQSALDWAAGNLGINLPKVDLGPLGSVGGGRVSFPSIQLPGAARGLWSVPGMGLGDSFPAMLAPGEMVVPSDIAGGLREQFAGGYAPSSHFQTMRSYTLEIRAYDSKDILDHADDIADALDRRTARAL